MDRNQENILLFVRNLDHIDQLVESEFFDQLDWEQFLKGLLRHKIFPIGYLAVKSYIPEKERAAWASEYDKHKRKVDVLYSQLLMLLEATQKAGLELILHKGFALTHLLYHDNHAERYIGDIDFLIKEQDIYKIHEFMTGMGYFHACGKQKFWTVKDKDDLYRLEQPLIKDLEHHEFYGYYKEVSELDAGFFEVEFGRYLHQTVKLPHIDEFIQSAQCITLSGLKVRTLDLNHTFLALCESAYNDAEEWSSGTPYLRLFIELKMFIQSYCWLDWEQIHLLIQKYGMQYEVKSVLNNFMSVFGDSLEESVVQIVKQLFQENDDTPIYNDKYRFAWEIHFLDRLFLSNEQRQREVFSMATKRCYSDENACFRQPYLLKRKIEGNLEKVHNARSFDLKYSMNYDDKYLNINLYVGDDLYKHLHSHQVIVSLIDPTAYSSDLTKNSLSFSKVEDQIVINDELWEEVNVELDQERKVIVLKFLFDTLPVIHIGPKTVVAYSISIASIVHGFIYHWLTDNPYNKGFWEKPTIAQFEE